VQYDNSILSLSGSGANSFLLINTDTISYEFFLNTNTSSIWTIGAEDTITVNLPTLSMGTHAILSSTATGSILGTACILQVDLQGDYIYSWDLWEINAAFSQDVAATNVSSIPSTYRPNVFTINTDPLAPMDTSNAIIYGAVGDTLIISVLNSGNMTHNIHFHGYHVTILSASLQTDRVGWSKDSFPVKVGETMTLRLVPDQPGVYPVHNHNLATLLFNNSYPSGMMTMLKINP
jgi:FtsP/CotA-like multicopper oxidase with cupredoxin domain